LSTEFKILVTRLVATKEEIATATKKSHDELSHIQSKITDLMHVIEFVSMSASMMSKLSKELKLLLGSRRIHKENLIISENIMKNGKDPFDEMSKSDIRMKRYEIESGVSFKKFRENYDV